MLTARDVECGRARAAAIESLRALDYAVSGIYEPMPGKEWIVAAERTTPKATYRSSVSVQCGNAGVTVALRQLPLAKRDPHFAADFRDQWFQKLGRARAGVEAGASSESRPGEVMLTSPQASGLTVRVRLLRPGEARERFGVDLAAAGLTAVALRIENAGRGSYIVVPRLLGLERRAGEVVAALRWSEASARLAQAGMEQASYGEIRREILEEQVLQPGARAAGHALYPQGEFRRVRITLVEQQSGQSVLLEGELSAQ